jgi:L-rhamnose mutarotase
MNRLFRIPVLFSLSLLFFITGCNQESQSDISAFQGSIEAGYLQEDFPIPVKRYCQILTLRDDPDLITEYREWHSKVWPEVLKGIKSVGILDHEIYMHGNTLFMVLVVPHDFDFDKQMSLLATLPRQAEWEASMAKFQNSDASASSADKWTRMERIFKLN